MKKRKLITLAMLGISMGLLVGGCEKAEAEQMSPEMKSFYEQLAPNAKKQFLELDAQHKKMAMEIVNQYCKGASQCKGHREQAVQEEYNRQMQERSQIDDRMNR